MKLVMFYAFKYFKETPESSFNTVHPESSFSSFLLRTGITNEPMAVKGAIGAAAVGVGVLGVLVLFLDSNLVEISCAIVKL